jgi:beta-lactamase class A
VGRSKLLFMRYFRSGVGHCAPSRRPRLWLAASLAVAALTGTASTLAQPAGDIEVKARPVARGYYNLREGMDLELQRQLRRSVRELGLESAIEDKHLSVALVDVTEPDNPRLAMINGDEMMYAASLPKIAILFGAFQKIHEGRLRFDDALRQQMVDMIRVSSNEAATYVLNKVGRGYLANLLQSRQYRLYDASLNGGLWVGKAYASGSAYQRDPLHNISHGATAYQVARFYYLMETGRLVSPEYSRQMKEIMANPGIHHKFVKGLEESRPDARIYRKSGTWREYHADSAIVERAGRRYIAVAIAEHRKGGEWMQKLIVAMDDIVFSQPRPIQSASLN